MQVSAKARLSWPALSELIALVLLTGALTLTGCTSRGKTVRVLRPPVAPGPPAENAAEWPLFSAAAQVNGAFLKVSYAEAVACSLKVRETSAPPHVIEDAVVLLEIDRESKSPQWELLYLFRHCPYKWEGASFPPGSVPPYKTSAVFPKQPSQDEINRFVHATDLGYNSYEDDVSVLMVYAFRPSKTLAQTLARGLSPQEKQQRRRAWREIFIESFHPIPTREGERTGGTK